MAGPLYILGLMSGSSLDGCDLALCRFSGTEGQLSWKFIQGSHIPYSAHWRKTLIELPEKSAIELARTDARFSKYIGLQILEMFKSLDPLPDYISSHGHTIFHEPERNLTYQIINGGYLSAYLNVSTVSDFRSQDVALSGQGAPIVPIAERDLFQGFDYYLNLGGICNISLRNGEQIRAYDVCPCNQVLNQLAQEMGKIYDEDGKDAAHGCLNMNLFDSLNANDYYEKLPPKSLDNSWVKNHFMSLFNKSNISVQDKLHTMVHHIVHAIQEALTEKKNKDELDNLPTKKMLVTGGGANNLYLTELLRNKLALLNIKLVVPDKKIIDYKEAILMAYMGYLRICQEINVLSSVTGAKTNSVSGSIYYVSK